MRTFLFIFLITAFGQLEKTYHWQSVDISGYAWLFGVAIALCLAQDVKEIID